MDARDAVARLRECNARQGGTGAMTPRLALAAFVEFAREPADYEGGGVTEDLVRFATSTWNDDGHWIGNDPRPEPGALILEFARDINIYDDDGEHQEWAELGTVLALPPRPPSTTTWRSSRRPAPTSKARAQTR